MHTTQVEVAIIGAGTAGIGAYRAAREHTDSILVIEGGPYGTTCARFGCMPSKLLIAAADAAHSVRHADLFGVDAAAPIVVGEKVMERVRRERDRFVGVVKMALEQLPNHHKIRGYARFMDDHRLMVDHRILIEAERIVIATGSRPTYPPFFTQAGDRLLVNDDVFELNTLPKSVVVFGPGAIGLELGQSLSRLGVEVRVLGVGGKIGPLKDPQIRSCAQQVFNREFYLDPKTRVESICRVDGGVQVTYFHRDAGKKKEVFEYLIAATGRRPNVDGLDLDNTSLTLDELGVPVFDPYTLRAGKSTIFIAGDAGNDRTILHEAADEGRIAGHNAGLYPRIRSGLRRTPFNIVFSDPQITTVGLNIQQVRARCGDGYAVGYTGFENQGRSRVIGKNTGLLHVYGEQGTGLLLGAEMFGPAAEHLGHLISWAVQKRMTVSETLEMPFYHPVIEEGLRTALRDLSARLELGPAVAENCLDCGVGA